MIYDCFTYWNEKEILFLRLKHLWDYVDKFVIVESNVTHRGRPKDWNLEELLETELEWAKEKIIYVKKTIDISNLDLDHKSDRYDSTTSFWMIENEQRNAIMEGIEAAHPDDIIMISDVDEFPSTEIVKISHDLVNIYKMVSLSMKVFNYYLNVQNTNCDHWKGTVIGKKSSLGYETNGFMVTPQIWRDERNHMVYMNNGGYHFTWLGKEGVKNKFKNTAHDEVEKFGTDDNIEKTFTPDENGVFGDLLGVESSSQLVNIQEDPNYPRVVLENLEKYPHLFYDSSSTSPQ